MHDTHFLERLSRVSQKHTELALRLYRSPELIRFVFEHSRTAQNAERLAIALEDGGQGPHVIVERGGHFVTCLGEGMKVGNLPIIARAQLDGLRARFEPVQQATNVILERAKLGVNPFIEALRSGPALTREDAEPLIALGPILGPDYFLIHHEALPIANGAVGRSLRTLNAGNAKYLQAVAESFWIAWNAVLFGAIGIRPMLGPESPLRTSYFLIYAFRSMTIAATARALWAVCRGGKPLLPQLKERYRRATVLIDHLEALGGLVALACSHEGLRDEIAKVLRATPGNLGEGLPEWKQAVFQFHKGIVPLLLENPREATKLFHQIAREVTFERLTGEAMQGADGEPPPYATAEEIPEEVAITAWLSSHTGLHRVKQMFSLLVALPTLARMPASAFFHPRGTHERLMRRPTAEDGFEISQALRRLENPPDRRPETPPPNAPCHCGSGRKFKRCHALESA